MMEKRTRIIRIVTFCVAAIGLIDDIAFRYTMNEVLGNLRTVFAILMPSCFAVYLWNEYTKTRSIMEVIKENGPTVAIVIFYVVAFTWALVLYLKES